MADRYTKQVIGAFLRLYRAMHGMKQATLAGILDMNHTQLSFLERGVRMPTAAQMVKIARKCNVCINDLLGIGCPNSDFLLPKIEPRTKRQAVLYAEELLSHVVEQHGNKH